MTRHMAYQLRSAIRRVVRGRVSIEYMIDTSLDRSKQIKYAAVQRHVPHEPQVTSLLDKQHEWVKLLLGGLYTAHVSESTKRVADLGCGTGIWSREFAVLHPHAKVIGVDLNPPQPLSGDPRNVKFVSGDILDEWSFATRPFDFIWFRFVFLGMTSWALLFQRVAQNLKSGGQLEFFDFTPLMQAKDSSVTSKDSALLRWYDAFWTRLRECGVDVDASKEFRSLVKAAGMEVIKEDSVIVYYGEQAALEAGGSEVDRQVAQLYLEDITSVLRILVDKFFNDSTTPTLEEMHKMTNEAEKDVRTNSAKGYNIKL